MKTEETLYDGFLTHFYGFSEFVGEMVELLDTIPLDKQHDIYMSFDMGQIPYSGQELPFLNVYLERDETGDEKNGTKDSREEISTRVRTTREGIVENIKGEI